jgi:hypothetical protein
LKRFTKPWTIAVSLLLLLFLASFGGFVYWTFLSTKEAIQEAFLHPIIKVELEQMASAMIIPKQAEVITKAVGLASPPAGAPPLAALTPFVIWELTFQERAKDQNLDASTKEAVNKIWSLCTQP